MTCSKIKFDTKKEAITAIKAGKQRFKRFTSKWYRCRYCGSFHLTTCDSKRREEARIASKGVKEG
jgi:hypothetical protein